MSSDVPLKRCPTCPEGQQWHDATTEFFYRRSEGLRQRCKECENKEKKAYRQRPEVQEHAREWKETYYQEHKGHILAKGKVRYQEKREQILEQVKTYRQRNLERSRTRERTYRSRPEIQERTRIMRNTPQYRELHRIQERSHAYKRWERRQERRKNNLAEVRLRDRVDSHIRRARARSVLGTHSPEQIQDLLKRQKHHCYYCSAEFEKRNGEYVYHVDHTFPISRIAGSDIPANDISYLVLACPTCNDRKKDKFPWEWHEGGRLL